ncbi:MAG: Jag N-terminal domain-containing protein, partial [Oscillibacter sp.]|nr:Jag N-terminal domain-containing protein [Oscillibacter sp.]
MREFIDVTGKTEEEAIRKALEQLGLDRDDVSVEILERAKSGFLGLGAAPAKVRVRYGEDDEPAPSKPEKKERPVRDTQPEKAEKSDRPEKTERAEKADRPEKAERSEKRDRPRRDRQSRESRPAERPETKAEAARPVQDLGEEVDDEKAAAIKTFLTGLLAQMESEAAIHVYQPEKGRYKVILEGQGLGALIGRRGETLDAIQ